MLQMVLSATAGAQNPEQSPPPAPAPETPAPDQPAAAAAEARTVSDGVFTVDQARRGEQAFQRSCAACHNIAEFSGSGFQQVWDDRSLGDIHRTISTMMPQDAPGSLTAQQYTDIITYMLRENGYPAGQTELPPISATLRQIRIVPATGN